MLLSFCSARNRTSGPKGRKVVNVYAGDESPAYQKMSLFGPYKNKLRISLVVVAEGCIV
jgi:hypothetical protein